MRSARQVDRVEATLHLDAHAGRRSGACALDVQSPGLGVQPPLPICGQRLPDAHQDVGVVPARRVEPAGLLLLERERVSVGVVLRNARGPADPLAPACAPEQGALPGVRAAGQVRIGQSAGRAGLRPCANRLEQRPRIIGPAGLGEHLAVGEYLVAALEVPRDPLPASDGCSAADDRPLALVVGEDNRPARLAADRGAESLLVDAFAKVAGVAGFRQRCRTLERSNGPVRPVCSSGGEVSRPGVLAVWRDIHAIGNCSAGEHQHTQGGDKHKVYHDRPFFNRRGVQSSRKGSWSRFHMLRLSYKA